MDILLLARGDLHSSPYNQVEWIQLCLLRSKDGLLSLRSTLLAGRCWWSRNLPPIANPHLSLSLPNILFASYTCSTCMYPSLRFPRPAYSVNISKFYGSQILLLLAWRWRIDSWPCYRGIRFWRASRSGLSDSLHSHLHAARDNLGPRVQTDVHTSWYLSLNCTNCVLSRAKLSYKNVSAGSASDPQGSRCGSELGKLRGGLGDERGHSGLITSFWMLTVLSGATALDVAVYDSPRNLHDVQVTIPDTDKLAFGYAHVKSSSPSSH